MPWLTQILYRHKTNLALFFAIWLIYAVHVVPGGGVNPNRYFDLTHSIVNQGTLSIDAYHENTIDKAFKDGHYYSAGLPGPSVVAIPAYLLFKGLYSLVPQDWLRPLSLIQSLKQGVDGGFYQQDTLEFFLSTIWITVFTLSVISALSAVVLYRLVIKLGLSSTVAFVTLLVYGFGTPVFFYSTTYFSHEFNAAIVITMLYLMFSLDTAASWTKFLLGLLAGMTLLVEYQGSIFISIFGLYVFYRYGWRGTSYYALGVGIPLSLLFLYNYTAFGSPLAVPHEWLVGPNRLRTHGTGMLGFTVPVPDRLLELTISPERGLFLYVPVLALVPIGWFRARGDANARVRDIASLSVLGTVVALLWLAAYTDWFGGISFGPRHLVSTLPFLFVGLAFGLRSVSRYIWFPLVAISVLTNWLGAQYGFAANVFEHWSTFFSKGFMLPWALAIVTHSRGSNALLDLVTQYSWAITSCYALVIVFASAICVRAVRATDDQLNNQPMTVHCS